MSDEHYLPDQKAPIHHQANLNLAPIELSEVDLDAISAGVVNVSFSFLSISESSEFSSHQISDGYTTSITNTSRHRRSIFGFEFSGTFASMDHAMSFFTGFLSFLDRWRRR